MINRRMMALAAAVLPATALFSRAQAQTAPASRLKAIVDSGKLRVGTTGDFQPMSFKTVSGYEGHQIDMANLLAADMGVKVEFVATDWRTLISGLAANQYDIVITGTSMSVGRAMAATFVDPWGRNAFVPLALKANAGRFASWDQLNQPGVTIGTNLGTTMEQFVQQTLPKATLRRVESPARDWQELLGGRVDVTMSSLIEAAALTREYPQLTTVLAQEPRNPIPMALLIPQGDPTWLAFLNNWNTLRKANGTIDALNAKWGVVGNG
jgi:cyclohexadienyl dehydratase